MIGAHLPLFLTSAHVAGVIGLDDADAFLRQRPRLETEHLFPLPLPVSRRPLRWRADEVLAWLHRQGRPMAPGATPEDIASGRVVLLDMARTA